MDAELARPFFLFLYRDANSMTYNDRAVMREQNQE